jgi:small-conductance mechanosensitive channel
MLTVAVTSLILMLVGAPEDSAADTTAASDESVAVIDDAPSASADPLAATKGKPAGDRARAVAKATEEQAERTFGDLGEGVVKNLPKLTIVSALLVAAWLLVRIARGVLRRTLADWPRANAATAMTGVSIWVATVAISVTILAGDVRAFVGSVGLLGLALSWALQTPIESFTGWLLNAFKGYYRIGDRVEVGEVYGDVHRIDVLTTTVWEIGSPFRPSFVHAEQPTGRIITFPNKEVLTGSVMNYTKDFPFVWDELSVAIANESDARYACDVIARVARELLGEEMAIPAREYEQILRRGRVDGGVADVPEVFVSLEESWINVSIRYLVDARKRRRWKTDLVLRISDELRREEHRGKIIGVTPRRQVQIIGRDGLPRDPRWLDDPADGVADGARTAYPRGVT